MAAEDQTTRDEREGGGGAAGGRRGPTGGPPDPVEKKKDQKKQTIIAAAAILGVMIAWLSLRKSSASSSTAAGTYGGSIGAYTPTGTVAGQGTDSSALQGFQTLLANQSQQLAGLESALAGLTPAASTQTPPAATPLQFDLSGAASDKYLIDYSNNATGAMGKGAIYQVQNVNGTAQLFHLNPEQWAIAQNSGLGKSSIITVGKPAGK